MPVTIADLATMREIRLMLGADVGLVTETWLSSVSPLLAAHPNMAEMLAPHIRLVVIFDDAENDSLLVRLDSVNGPVSVVHILPDGYNGISIDSKVIQLDMFAVRVLLRKATEILLEDTCAQLLKSMPATDVDALDLLDVDIEVGLDCSGSGSGSGSGNGDCDTLRRMSVTPAVLVSIREMSNGRDPASPPRRVMSIERREDGYLVSDMELTPDQAIDEVMESLTTLVDRNTDFNDNCNDDAIVVTCEMEGLRLTWTSRTGTTVISEAGHDRTVDGAEGGNPEQTFLSECRKQVSAFLMSRYS